MGRGVPNPGGEHDQVLPPGRHAHGKAGRGPGQSRRVVIATRWTEPAVSPETIRGHLAQHISSRSLLGFCQARCLLHKYPASRPVGATLVVARGWAGTRPAPTGAGLTKWTSSLPTGKRYD